jgi:RNA recognition motif-containing protein
MSRIPGKDAQLFNRILYVKNLSFKVTTEELFDLFGRFGAIRQIRLYVLRSTSLHIG